MEINARVKKLLPTSKLLSKVDYSLSPNLFTGSFMDVRELCWEKRLACDQESLKNNPKIIILKNCNS